MVSYIRSDLEFILDQIKIAEAHTAGADLVSLLPNPSEPLGLRTVDGTLNNLIPGQEHFGSADTVFPRGLEVLWRPGDAIEPGSPFGPPGPTSYEQTSGVVVDSQLRIISNLIVDQTANNPAALEAAGDNALTENGSLVIENQAPDEGLSAPFNSWMTLFGQFFDHGLDLVNKGGNGIVFVPLQPDDPLYVVGSNTNFMLLTRATNQPGPDGQLGTADDVREHSNDTTAWIDQNQTYTSNPSHQAFLREYRLDAQGNVVATGKLLEGPEGGLATWGDIVAQARDILGIALDHVDVVNVPMIATDLYGNFLPGANGMPQLVTAGGLVEGDRSAPVSAAAVGGARTGHAFLEDIAHSANPVSSQTGQFLTPDADTEIGGAGPGTFDDELLSKHYIAGDGRANENIGLTAVHHVFHAEHNRLLEHTKQVILETGDLAFIAEWQNPDGTWNGERLFQAAKFGTEMQYQHLVFEEFARKVQPAVNVFAGYDYDIDPSILAEFAHVVYRFGHSMLRETVDMLDQDGNVTQMGLIEAFLNPVAFATRGPSAYETARSIVEGMTRQVGNEIDEFITGALRDNLVGLPLDLAVLNLARARETGVPGLNEARRQFFEDTGDTRLKPYEDWVDFTRNVKNEASVINFIAAYGTHELILAATTVEEKRQAAMDIVFGNAAITEVPGTGIDFATDRIAFLNGTGRWADDASGRSITGLEAVDFWVGGLAERITPFGGMLGSTFNFVFETQLEKLQDGDRFYYLLRTEGTHFIGELEGNSFASLIMRNTNATHLPGDVFSTPDHILEVDITKQVGPDPVGSSPFVPLVERSDGNGTPNFLRYNGDGHVVLGGTAQNDTLISGKGDDTVWGDEGDDDIEGGEGVDLLNGGDGDDVITDIAGDDNIKGGDGNDAIHGGAGIDLILSGPGSDFVMGGADDNEVFASLGNDFVYGGDGLSTLHGNEGDDWLEGGPSANLLFGDNADPLGDRGVTIGHDVFKADGNGAGNIFAGEAGDDIIFLTSGPDNVEGGFGFDWVTFAEDPDGTQLDMLTIPFGTPPVPPSPENVFDELDEVEAVSGSRFADILLGTDIGEEEYITLGATFEYASLITGFVPFLGARANENVRGEVLLGGAGSDTFMGRDGDDIIDGDLSLDVYLRYTDVNGVVGRADTMLEIQERVFNREIRVGDIEIVREIIDDSAANDFDTAIFRDIRANYSVVVNATTGVVSVTHLNGDRFDDGSDRLTNIERLQFADDEIVLGAGNASPVGQPILSDETPVTGVELSVDLSQITDADNIDASNPTGSILDGAYQIAWEFTNDDDPTALPEWEPAVDVLLDVPIFDATFTPGAFYIDSRIRVRVTYQDDEGNLEIVYSEPTAFVVANPNPPAPNLPPVGGLVISDTTPEIGQTLTVSAPGLTDANNVSPTNPTGIVTAPVVFVWQKLVNGVFEDILDPVTGTITVGPNFTPGPELLDVVLRVRAEYTDDAGYQNPLVSPQTSAVFGNVAPQGAPALSTGAPVEGEPMTVSFAGVTDANGVLLATLAFQWQESDGAGGFVDIPGATGASFTPTADQTGDTLRVRATFIDGDGFAETVFSAPTAVVAPPTPTNTAPVVGPVAVTTSEDVATASLTAAILAQATDADGDTMSVGSVDATGALGLVTLVGGQVVYNPNGQFEALNTGDTATDSFQVTVVDGNGGATTTTVTVTIDGADEAPANNPPTAAPVSAATDEDTATADLTAAVLSLASDLDGDTLSITAIDTTGTLGLVTLGAGGLVYNPNGQFEALNGGQSGTDSFAVTISDGNGGTTTATVTLTVNGVTDPANTPPTGGAITITTDEDTSSADLTAAVLAAASDADGDTLTIAGVDTVLTSGAVTLNAGGLVYNPNAQFEALDAGETEPDSFDVIVSDGQGGTAIVTVSVTVTGVTDTIVNNPPVAGPVAVTTDEDTETGDLTAAVLAAASDPDLDDLEILDVITTGTLGLVTLDDVGLFYSPNGLYEGLNAGQTATDSFIVVIDDGAGGQAQATVTVTIDGVTDVTLNTPPTADPVAVATTEDLATGDLAAAILAAGFDADGDPLTITAVNGAGATGVVTFDAGEVIYTPNGQFEALNAGDTATDSFVVTLSDGLASVQTTVTVTINGVTDSVGVPVDPFGPPPAATILGTPGDDGNLRGGALADVIDALAGVDAVRGGDGDDTLLGGEGGDELRGNAGNDDLRGGAGNDVLTGNGDNDTLSGGADADQLTGSTGADLFVFGSGYGADTITDFRTEDGILLVGTTFTSAAQAAAAIVGGVLDLGGGDVLTIVGDPVTAADITLHGVVTPPANTAPTAGPVAAATNEDTGTASLNAAILAQASDVDGDTLTITAVGAAGIGLASLVAGQVVYNPNGAFEALNTGQNGADSFEVTISDGQGGFTTTTVTMTIAGVTDVVNPGNTPPTAGPVAAATDEDTPTASLNATILAQAADLDGDTLTIMAVDGGGANGLVTFVGGQVVYDPAGAFEFLDDGETATDSFDVTIADGQGGTASTTITMTVNGVTDPLAGPIAAPPPATLLGTAGPDGDLRGSDAADVIDALGGADAVRGGGGADFVLGGEGADDIRGNAGNDTLRGGDDADVLTGNGDNDLLWGGLGDGDVMTGGSGVDSFVFMIGDGSDTITDFRAGEEIYLVGTGFSTGADAFAAVVGGVLDFGNGDALTILGSGLTAESFTIL